MSTIFYGALITPVSLTAYDALPRALLAVSRASGDIDWIERDVPPAELQDVLARHGVVAEDVDLVELRHGEFLMPGFIDTHIVSPAAVCRAASLRAKSVRDASMRRKCPTSAGVFMPLDLGLTAGPHTGP